MDIIFCLVGASGSGKTTIAKRLADDGLNVIQSYTTRPPRHEDEWGHTYVYAYPQEDAQKTIAYNQFNGFEYWATDDQYEGKGKSVYIIDPPGDAQLRKTVNCSIVTIYLFVGWDKLKERLVRDRGSEKAYERIAHDRPIFATVKTDWVVDTDRYIDDVYADITAIIDNY